MRLTLRRRFIVVPVVLFGAGIWIALTSDAFVTRPVDCGVIAFCTAEAWIESQIHDGPPPEFTSLWSAKDKPTTGWRELQTNAWDTWGIVITQTSSGAKLRRPWRVTIEKRGDKWYLQSAHLGDTDLVPSTAME